MKRFLQRWRAWRHALAVLIDESRRARLRVEFVLIVETDPADPEALTELRAWLPGWRVDPLGEYHARLTPPAIEACES